MKAWELLSDKSKWTTGSYARNAVGDPCPFDGQAAACWCAIGAVEKCHPLGDHYSHVRDRWVQVLRRRHPGMSLYEVNDQLGYDAVLAVLKEADV